MPEKIREQVKITWSVGVRKMQRVAKAIAGGVAAAAAYMLGVVSTDVGLVEAFTELNATQWFGLVLSILGSYGIVYRIPNKE